mmetsp:Transcript_61847/g.70944  ORF Transcript_61847/g.70944 Transcript_61847/m.70944 type:complete len:491 (+) Transcript_61847:34-1506(+)
MNSILTVLVLGLLLAIGLDLFQENSSWIREQLYGKQPKRKTAQVLEYFQNYERENHPDLTDCRLAWGYFADLDVLVNGVPYMNSLGYEKPPEPVYHDFLNNMQDFAETFAFFFSKGAANEMFLDNVEDWSKVRETAFTNKRDAYYGGNALWMAKNAARIGCRSLLGAIVDPDLKQELTDLGVETIGTVIPAEEFDVHILMEYVKTESWGKLFAPRSNRYYVNRDQQISKLEVLDAYHEEIKKYKPDFHGIGGLHLLEPHFEGSDIKDKLYKMKAYWAEAQQRGEQIHLELAAFNNLKFYETLADTAIKQANSIGLNEQELAILHSYLSTQSLVAVSDTNPDANAINGLIVDTLKLMIENGYEVNRMHLHSLNVHSVCYKESHWGDGSFGLISSALIAARMGCRVETLTEDLVTLYHPGELIGKNFAGQEEHLAFYPSNPVMKWKLDLEFICLSIPAVICHDSQRSANLGDNISSTGLTYHRPIKQKTDSN